MIRAILCLLACLEFVSVNAQTARTVHDFRLKNTNGKMVSLSDYPSAKGFIIVFTCNHCPFAKRYPGRMNELNEKYKKLGVPLVAISSADTTAYDEDAYPEMVKRAKAGHYNFPYLYDPMQTVARNFAASKTPHAFVIWKQQGNWVVKYDGGIDDNGAEPAKVRHAFVRDAVEALLANKDVPVKETRSVGCAIHYRP
ncbi:MAG: thioredoxin family protein [Bacteroidetes bacterium]|nr:thioredoxin family protein [Bacteroidota bacterium]